MESGREVVQCRHSIRATCASRAAKSLLQILHQPLSGPARHGALLYAWARFKGCLKKEAPYDQDVAVAVAWGELLETDEANWWARTPLVTVRTLADACGRYLSANQVLLHQYPVPMATRVTCVGDQASHQIHLETRDYYQVGPYAIPRWQGEEGAIFVRLDDMPAHLADAARQYQGDVPQSLPGAIPAEVFEAFLLTQPNQVELDLLAGYQMSSSSAGCSPLTNA